MLKKAGNSDMVDERFLIQTFCLLLQCLGMGKGGLWDASVMGRYSSKVLGISNSFFYPKHKTAH